MNAYSDSSKENRLHNNSPVDCADCTSNPEPKPFESYVIISLVCTLWIIWKGRNSFYFQGLKPNPMETVIKANIITEEYSKRCSTERRGSDDPVIRGPETRNNWRPPLQGIVKINSDTSFNQITHQAHGFFLARDYLGGFIAGHSSSFVASSPFAAEAVALRDALNWARCLGLENAVFEADNLELINTCRKDFERIEISGFVKDRCPSEQK